MSGKVKSRKSKVKSSTSSVKAVASAVPQTLPLLVEIGCEEIPARFLPEAQESFGRALEAALRGARLLPEAGGPLETFSTPRRLVACAREVLDRQPDKVEEILGPPVKVAFDAQGKPTRAAESFAQKNGERVSELKRTSTPRGEYLAVRKTLRGHAAPEILAELLPSVVAGLSFPKSMYWVAKSGPTFVRPIRWLLALLGEGKQTRIVPFQIAGVRSGDRTRGHRAMGASDVRVGSFREFAAKLRRLHVDIDSQARRERVRKESKVLLEKLNLALFQDSGLEDWVVHSTEWPRALLGGFDRRFLHLPREILTTVMRDHQKYFAVEDRKGKLQPRFLAVLNVDPDANGLIRAGHERVLEARFSDAEFFWNADQKTPLGDRQAALEGVTYQADLGSYGAKTRRMKSLAAEICRLLEAACGLSPEQRQATLRAVELAKCDLVTQMVGEFPELQGIVGGLYARAQGEPEAVAEAVYDHYLPKSLEDPCPRSIVGAVISLADKVDSVVGGFAVGLEPTGSSDPFALRRAGNGLVKVLVELSLAISLKQIVQQALTELDVEWRRPREEVFGAILAFFEERLRYYLESVRGLRYDTVRAVLGAGADVPADALARAQAVEKIRQTADFEALSVAAKRIKNILAKSASAADWQPGEVKAEMLEAGPEQELYRAYQGAEGEAGGFFARREYAKGLKRIAGLRAAVDRFFDQVLVMAPDPAVRQNRLRLLGKLDKLFSGVARLAEIVPAARVDAPTSGRAARGK